MTYFEKDAVHNALNETYAFIKVAKINNTLEVRLDRAEKKNAIHPHMVNEIAFALQYAKQSKEIWTVVLGAEGEVFCAGADLKAFMGMVGEYDSSIPKPNEEILLGELFKKVHKPIIAKVTGDVYAGGFFFLTGANYVVAKDDIVLGLPEVKRGLYPFQVMASLLEIMPKRAVVDWCIRGYNLPVEKAFEFGLVTHVNSIGEVDIQVDKIISDLHENSPTAISLGLESLEAIEYTESKHKYLMEMLQKTISSKDGQEGMMAFRQKRKPIWTGE